MLVIVWKSSLVKLDIAFVIRFSFNSSPSKSMPGVGSHGSMLPVGNLIPTLFSPIVTSILKYLPWGYVTSLLGALNT